MPRQPLLTLYEKVTNKCYAPYLDHLLAIPPSWSFSKLLIIADELAIIDHLVSDDDLTLYILNGLVPEFREIVAPIHAPKTSLEFEETHDLLVGH